MQIKLVILVLFTFAVNMYAINWPLNALVAYELIEMVGMKLIEWSNIGEND